MKKKLSFLFLVFLVSCGDVPSTSYFDSSSSSKNDTSTSSSSNSSSSGSIVGNKTNLYNATIENNMPDNYYESCRGLKGTALKEALYNIIKGHTYFDYSETTQFYKDIDEDPYDSSKMYFIYTGSTSKSTGYNKEHIWAKSHGGFKNKYPMHSDLHNLHPCNNNLNSTRGNLDFNEGGELLSSYNGNNKRVNGTSFEPSDFSKGDVARTIFYMAVRYEGDGNEMDLELSSPSSNNYYDFSSGADGVHGNFDALYKWATSGQDPVDDYEVSRNNKIYSNYQKNRNPFIDHPEFIEMIYDKNYSGSGALIDNNPYVEESEDSKIERFIELVNSIQDITSLETKTIIENAESLYQSLSNESKNSVNEYYQKLMQKKTECNEYFFQYNIDYVIRLINEIGEVSLSSKDKIEKAEKEYNDLSNKQKEKVTNYDILVKAREDYNILLKENASTNFIFDFTSCTGVNSSYQSGTVVYEEKSIYFSQCYKDNNGIRFGSKSTMSIDKKFSSAIDGLLTACHSMELLFDISGTNISLTTENQYGTTLNLYLLKSNDGGNTWVLSSTISGKDNFGETKTHTFSLDPNYSRYAFVIDGSEPRLVVSKLEVK